MKSNNIYEIRLLDGTYYTGEISHMDDEMVVFKMGSDRLYRTLQVFHDMILSIQHSPAVGKQVCFQE